MSLDILIAWQVPVYDYYAQVSGVWLNCIPVLEQDDINIVCYECSKCLLGPVCSKDLTKTA